MVNGLAFRLVGRSEDLDDLVQDCFVQALRSLDSLENPAVFSSWLSGIVARTSYNFIRKRRMLARLGLGRTSDDRIDVDALVAPTAPPDVAAELRALYGVLSALPAKVRVPLVLRRVEGMALAEIAATLGASLATVKRRVAEGEAALTRAMMGESR